MNIDIFFEFNIKRRRGRKKRSLLNIQNKLAGHFHFLRKIKKRLKMNIINFSNHENRYPRK